MTSRNHPHRLSLLLAGTALVTMAALPQSSFADPLRGSGAMVVAQAAPAENAPADNKREQRKPQERSNQQPHRLQQTDKWTPYGVGAIEGTARPALPVLPPATDNGAAASNGNGNGYAPGEEPRPREGEPTGSSHGELL